MRVANKEPNQQRNNDNRNNNTAENQPPERNAQTTNNADDVFQPPCTPNDQTQTFRTPASFVSVDEEEQNNHQPTRVLPRNIKFIPTQDDNNPNPVGTTRLFMTRMDIF